MPLDTEALFEKINSIFPEERHPSTGKLLQMAVGEGQDEQGEFLDIGFTDPDLMSEMQKRRLSEILTGVRFKISKLDGEILPGRTLNH